jgi:hypothetical protein
MAGHRESSGGLGITPMATAGYRHPGGVLPLIVQALIVVRSTVRQ